MSNKTYTKGTFLAILGGACWAIAGICGQYIFEQKHFDAQWYVTMRLQAAGVIMLFCCYKKYGKGMFEIWKSKKDAARLLVYGIVALMGVQFTHFLAIQYSNAATSTVIMYLSPAFVLAYISLRDRQRPSVVELLGVVLAMAGVFLLVTHGDITSLSITEIALFWSLVSAVLMAFYSVQPKPLIDKWGSLLTNGWGMFVGGIAIGLLNPPWKMGEGVLDVSTVIMMTFVVILGTVLAFYFFLEGMRIIGSKKASVYACAEPLFTAFLGVVCLDINFELMDWIGGFLIILTVVLLALEPGKGRTKANAKTNAQANVQADAAENMVGNEAEIAAAGMAGNVSARKAANATSSMAGNATVSMAGNVSARKARNATSSMAGNATVSMAGNVSARKAGNAASSMSPVRFQE